MNSNRRKLTKYKHILYKYLPLFCVSVTEKHFSVYLRSMSKSHVIGKSYSRKSDNLYWGFEPHTGKSLTGNVVYVLAQIHYCSATKW